MSVLQDYFALVRAARELFETRGAPVVTVEMPRETVESPRKRRASCDSARAIAARKAWERRREAEEAVTCNLPPDLLALWRRTRGLFSGSPAERLDAFMQYAHDHEAESVATLQDEAEATVARMVRERTRADRGAK